MTHTVWHFQIFICRKDNPTFEVMAYDSQKSMSDKIRRGFGNRFRAEREGKLYARLTHNPADENPVVSARVQTFEVAWSDYVAKAKVFMTKCLDNLVDGANALKSDLPRIVYPE